MKPSISLMVMCAHRLIRNFPDGYLISQCVFRSRQDNINFPVCFPETVEIILFTLTVYAVIVKINFETIREFHVSSSVVRLII
jgi:hypothetical protein